MKKILLLLLIGAFISIGAFAQEESGDEDMSYYIDLFTSGEFENVDLAEVFDDETLDSFGEAGTQEEVILAMEEAGVDADIQADTLAIMTVIAAADPGDVVTLSSAAADAGVDLDNITDGIVVLIANEVTDQLFTDEQEEEMKETFKTIANGLNMLSEFGQANAQSSVSSSLFGYQGYKHFALTFGTSISVAADSDTMGSVSELINNDEDMVEALEAELEAGGFSAGFAMQGFTASFGLNLSWLIDRLYVGAVFGSMNVNVSSDTGISSDVLGISAYNDPDYEFDYEGVDLSLSTSTFGITANYQFIKPIGIPILFRWNGLSFGTGLIANTFNVTADIEKLTTLFGSDDSEDTADVDLGAKFSIDSTSFTIPFEASTGVQLLSMVTVTAGAGIDLKFGTSSVNFEITSEEEDSLLTAVMEEVITQAFRESETDVTMPYSSDGEVNFINPRLMLGAGLGLGPVVVDISATYYILSGLNLGANFILRF